MKKIRVGVVGLGHRGREIAKIFAKFDCAEIVATCDLFARNWLETQWLSNMPMCEMFPNAVFYESYDEMLDKAELDVVVVETGADIHAEFCAKALRHGINVLSDIPNVANLREAEELWKAAEASKARIYTGANPNYSKFTYLLKEFYRNGLLGKPYCMEAEYIHWSMPGDAGSIHLNENGNWRRLLTPIRYCTHSLGPLLDVLDEDLRYVTCFETGHHAPAEEYVGQLYEKPDMCCAQFRTESGVVVRLMRNGRCRANIGPHNYRVFGTEGYMEKIERMSKPVIRYNSTKELNNEMKEISGEMMPPAYANNPDATGHGGIDYAMIDHFLRAISGKEAEPITLKDGLRMTLPGIYAEESMRRGGEIVRIKYPWDEDWSCEF